MWRPNHNQWSILENRDENWDSSILPVVKHPAVAVRKCAVAAMVTARCVSVSLILGQQKKPSCGNSHVVGAEVETTSVWTVFRRQKEKNEHLVVIHYSLQPPPQIKTNKCFPDLWKCVCDDEASLRAALVSHDYLRRSGSSSLNHWGNPKNVGDFVFFSVNFGLGKLAGNLGECLFLKRKTCLRFNYLQTSLVEKKKKISFE